MKITVNFDLTPAEMRHLFGLPDVEEFQRQLMNDIRERMMSGVEGYDPMKLFQPYMAGTMASWDLMQKFMTGTVPQSKSSGDAAASEPKK